MQSPCNPNPLLSSVCPYGTKCCAMSVHQEIFAHPDTGHAARAYIEEWDKPTQITVEIAPSRYLPDGTPCQPGEAGDYTAEMSGVVMLDNPDGTKTAKMWVQVTDGKTIPKALLEAASLVQSLWNECKHSDEPGVPHCYCAETFELGPDGQTSVLAGLGCCRCDASAPLSYFDGSWAKANPQTEVEITKAYAEAAKHTKTPVTVVVDYLAAEPDKES